jgi:hypothetical protein
MSTSSHTWTKRSRLGTVAGLLLLSVSPIAAQSVRGRVVDEATQQPLSGALISLLDGGGREVRPGVRSDSGGAFFIQTANAGTYTVKAVRIGYRQLVSSPIRLGTGVLLTLRLPMSVVAQRITSVEVLGQRHLTLFELMSPLGFDLRRQHSLGWALSAEDLAYYGAADVRTVLTERRLMGVHVVSTPSGGNVAIQRCGGDAMHPNRDTLVKVLLDGVEITGRGASRRTGGLADALLRLSVYPADALYGVEVYGKGQAPPPSLGGNLGGCTLAVWTKAYHDRMLARALTPPLPRDLAGFQVLRGVVLDATSGVPLEGAMLAVRTATSREDIERPVRTDSLGHFVLRIHGDERLKLSASLDGYLPVTTPTFPVDVGEVVSLELQMSATVSLAAPLTIVGRERPPRVPQMSLAGFDERRRSPSSAGVFFTSDSITERRVRSVPELLRGLPRVTVSRTNGTDEVRFHALGDAVGCVPRYFLDGAVVADRPQDLMSQVPMADLYGVEVYMEASKVPSEFSDGAQSCGAILVWIKRVG